MTIQKTHFADDDTLKRIAELEAELASVLSDWNGIVKASGSPTNGGAIGFVRAMKAERDALKADAERYRWLRDTDVAVVSWLDDAGQHWSISTMHNSVTRTGLDSAIDAAKGE